MVAVFQSIFCQHYGVVAQAPGQGDGLRGGRWGLCGLLSGRSRVGFIDPLDQGWPRFGLKCIMVIARAVTLGGIAGQTLGGSAGQTQPEGDGDERHRSKDPHAAKADWDRTV